MSTEAKKIPPIPYPLSRRARVAIMLSLIGAFCVIAPLVVLYARGYTYDFETKKVIHGGALSIETEPNNVSVYINDVKMKDSPPLKISHILPGNYHIKIERGGIFTWEKDISIVSNQTTYLHDIDLFEQHKLEVILNSEKKIDQLFPSHNNDFFIFSTHVDNTYELSLYNTKTQKESFLTRVISTTTPKVEWSESGEVLSIESVLNGINNILLMSPQNPAVIQAGSSGTENKLSYQWEAGGFGNALFFQNEDRIERMDLNITKPVFTLSTSTATWFVDKENTLWEYSDKSIRHYEDGKQTFEASVTKPLQKFLDVNNQRIIASDGTSLLIYTFEANNTLSENSLWTPYLTFYKEQNYHLAWGDGELFVLLPDGVPTLINRFSDTIQDVIPLTPVGTNLIVTPTKVFTFHPRYFLTHELVKMENIERVSVDKKRREMYVLGTMDGVRGVWRLGY